MTHSIDPVAHATQRRFGATVVILVAVAVVLVAGGLLYMHATGNTNKVALADLPRPVTTVTTVKRAYQPRRRYVGTVEPWVQAKVGPQMVAAYIDTVLVRPGAQVKRGEVIATLDCRSSSATSKAVAAQARALDAMRTASVKEATRVSSLLDGKFVSENEVDLKKADAASKEAQLASLQAQMINSSLQVDDCVLRAPFDGEIAERSSDPGTFVRPGSSIATVVDRHLVRITADVPEDDFANVPVGTEVKVHLLSTNRDLVAKVSRRAPSADADTRTVHVELDLDDPERTIPTWTTAELTLDVGQPVDAVAIPLVSASVHGSKATVYMVSDGVAHATRAKLIGERDGVYFIEPSLPAGVAIVTEGRGLLTDKDKVAATNVAWKPDAKAE